MNLKILLSFTFHLYLLGGILPALGQQAALSGKVIAEEQVLEGVKVSLDSLRLGTLTDSSGNFRLSAVPFGTHLLTFDYPGFSHPPLRVSLTATPESGNLGTITLTKDIQLNQVEILGEGDQGSEAQTRIRMLEAANITSVVGAEGIARLPDKNAAEAISRMPGVVMESDQGEGRYVSFRGTPTDWNSMLVNGDRMPVATEELEGRALSLDVLPASLLEYIEYNLNLRPNMEGDAIGGSGNFVTKQIPYENKLVVEAATGLNEKALRPVFNGSFLLGGRSPNKKWGYLLGASSFRRNWATDNYELFYPANDQHELQRLELRKYNGLRSTLGGNFRFDFRPTPNHTLYILGFGGRLNDDEYNRKTMYNWVAGVGQSIRLQNIHNIMQHQLWGGEVGGEHSWGKKNSLNWKVASYDAGFQYGPVPYEKGNPSNGYFVIEFEKLVRYTDILFLDENGNPSDEANSFSRQKLLDIDSPVEGYGDPYFNIQPTYDGIVAVKPEDTMFVFLKAFSELRFHDEQDPVVAALNFEHEAHEGLRFITGLKYRLKTGARGSGIDAWLRQPTDPDIIIYDDYNPVAIEREGRFLRELGTPYAGNTFSFFPNETIGEFLPSLEAEDRLQFLPFGPERTPYYKQFIGSNFSYEEQVGAVYGLAEWKPTTQWFIQGGLRLEYTQVKVEADSVVEVQATNERFLTKARMQRTYPAWLPMLNVSYKPGTNSRLRLAVTRTFRRPNFNELKPGEPEIHYDHFHVLAGNPDLRPTYSWNGDLSYQYLWGGNGFVMVSGFYKYITDHIFERFESQDGTRDNSVPSQLRPPGGIAAKFFENAPFAYSAGFEISVVRKLNMLPGFLSNLEIAANYAYVQARMQIDSRTDLQPLPRQSPHIVNLRLTYETERVNANVGFNYRASYLDELNLLQDNNEFDNFMFRSLGLDASFQYQLSKRLALKWEAINLLNAPYVEFRGVRERPVKTEYYGIRILLGLVFELNN